MIYTPRHPQQLIRNFALELSTGRGNIFASPGTGKTSASYEIFDIMRMTGQAKRALVIGPKRVAKNVWTAEREKWSESFGHLSVAAAIGTPDQRRAAIDRKPDILTINYENIEWLVDGFGDDWPFDTVFADESTRLKGLRVFLQTTNTGKTVLKGQGSTRAKSLRNVAHKHVRNWFNLTGSPAPNGVVDLWGQQWFIDAGRRLGTTFGGFKERWFFSHMTSDGYSVIKPRPHAQAEIEQLLKDCCLTIDARDYFDIGQVNEQNIAITLPPAARAAYNDMEKTLFALVDTNPVEAYNTGGMINKCLQMSSGSVYYAKDQWSVLHNEKIDALDSLVTELNGEPLLVRYCFRPDRERILKAFPRARFLDDKKATEDAWNAGDIPMLVTHAASAGHGLSLQMGGRNLCDYSFNYNAEEDEQIIERIGPTRQMQSGLDREVRRWRLVATDTLEDRAVLPALKNKFSVQDSLKLAMKR